MDLGLLRQLRSKENVFARGSPAYEQVALELLQLMPNTFQGLKKKSVRDRLLKVMEQFRNMEREEWWKRQ